MPIYEYECETCGATVEALQKFSDAPLTTCEHCSGKLHKIISQSTFHLKGTGWYVTDYANGKSSGSSPQKAKAKTDTPETDSPKTKTDKAASPSAD